jgi:mono/diheme cytochrome c family protein
MQTYAGQPAPRDQLQLLSELELFPMPAGTLAVLPDPSDEREPLQARARSYLHANCAHCHQPEGWSSPDLTMDLRFDRSLRDAEICGVRPMFFRSGSALIEPGAPEQSAILLRMRDTGLDRMPPVATTVVDPFADALLSSWISSLRECP